MNLCLLASGRVVENNAHCTNWSGGMYTLVMKNSVLSIVMLMVSSSWWGYSSTLLTGGLRVKLTVL